MAAAARATAAAAKGEEATEAAATAVAARAEHGAEVARGVAMEAMWHARSERVPPSRAG